MGTRNLTMVIRKQKPVVAQYGQWDGYPEGQGVTVLNFLRKVSKNGGMEKFHKRLDEIRFATAEDDAEMEKFFEKIGAKGGWMNSDQAEKYHKKYPFLTRDNGAQILNMIMESKGPIVLQDSSDFASDSLFCEWAYVIDLDKMKLEVYTGFNKRPLGKGQRFATIAKTDYKMPKDQDYNYFPIRCIKKFDIRNLPTKRVFISTLKKLTKDE